MEIIPKLINTNNINETLNYYVEDDQIRLLFIVILVIGIILLITGTEGAYLFLILGFALVAFICLFTRNQEAPVQLVETLTCQTLDLSHLEPDPIGITWVDPSPQNCQIKFRNSLRNKK
jgi:hypothetical protein